MEIFEFCLRIFFFLSWINVCGFIIFFWECLLLFNKWVLSLLLLYMLLLSFKGRICNKMLFVVICELLFLVYRWWFLGIYIFCWVFFKMDWLFCFEICEILFFGIGDWFLVFVGRICFLIFVFVRVLKIFWRDMELCDLLVNFLVVFWVIIESFEEFLSWVLVSLI